MPGFEKMGVASRHIQTLPYQIPSTFGQVCPYSHYNLVGERPTWKHTLSHLRAIGTYDGQGDIWA